MASPPAPPVPGDSAQRESLIRRQLARTSTQVRLVDLASGIAIWVIGVLLLFFLAALVDHFLGLGEIGRCIALAVLAAWSLWYLVLQVGPLLVRSINPAYAARTIEEATPTLKNSLINFLLLRHDRGGLKEIVYQAVERQAASDIAAVPVETTVDRSRLIYAGYVLCAVMAIFAAYKILSPKDPFQTIARVLAPWADIARPSRVQISEIEPGSAQIYHGQTVRVSATIRGLREADTAKVLFSTADGQVVDQPVEMKVIAGDRYECPLPPPTGNGPATAAGLLQDVTYRLVAGDAESFPFRLTVVSAPTIIVERLERAFPAYTKRGGDSLSQQGDIKALEGTKVTIHALANQPIKSAWIEFDSSEKAAAQIVPLAADGSKAHGTITLLLKDDRQTPWHTTYQVRFYNDRGQRSEQPILHKIEVIRDLGPEVQLLEPQRMRLEVPENGELEMQVRAVDPDFGLASVRIEGNAPGKPPLNVELLRDASAEPPQVTVPFVFRPADYQLSAGDELKYAAVAADNRASPLTGQPDPNIARTKEYTIVVVPLQKNSGGNSNQRPAPKGAAQNQQENKKQPPAGQQRSDPAAPQRPNEQPRNPDQKNSSPMQEGGQPDANQAGQQENRQQPDQQQPSAPQAGSPQSGQNQSTKGQKGQPQSGQGTGEQNQQPAGDQQAGNAQAGSKQQPGQSASGSQQGGSSAEGRSNAEGQESGGARQSNQRPSAGSRQAAGKEGDAANENNATSGPQGQSQGKADDGRAIEEIAKDLEKQGSAAQRSSQSSSRQQAQSAQTGDPQAAPRGGERSSEKGQGDKRQDQKAQGKSDSASGGSTEQQANSKSGQPQSRGPSEAQNQTVPSAGRAEGNDQRPDSSTAAPQEQGKAGDLGNRLPDDKQGQNPSEQPSGGNEGGAPRGPSKTDQGQKSSAAQGQQRDPGAGKNGDEGAGAASEDKTGSGDGTKQNLDRNKDQQPDSSKAEKSDASAASSSKRQSDSRGGDSGDKSGGGKKGAGQSAGQEGNDSAGSQSAADQGAGKAGETGSGETGSKAGQQQKAAGQTGRQGNEAGEGGGSRAGDQPAESGAPSNQPKKGQEGKPDAKTDSAQRATGGSSGSQPVGGADDDRQRFQNKTDATLEQQADAANLEYARKATEMVLKHLKEEEHNPDPDLLQKLGWTPDDLAEFVRRWEALQKSAGQSPEGKREMEEALKSLGLRDPANRRRAGGKANDEQRGVRDAGNRSAPPPRYRDLFDAFRKGASRSAP